MNNTHASQSNSSQSEPEYPHIIFSFARKDYTIAELLTIFSADFLELIYQHNVIPAESPFAAIPVCIATLNLLIIVVPSFTHCKIYYCNLLPLSGPEINITINCVL